MKHKLLKQLGLSDHQIVAYEYLLDNGPTPPPRLASRLKLTRTNAYKVLDQLVEIGLISRTEVNKKYVYKAEDPIALASIVAEERNRVLELEKNVKESVKALRQTYQKTAANSEVQTYAGNSAVKSLYEHQSKLAAPIYFIKTRSDIPFMGYETMDYIRRLPAKLGTKRFGIIPDAPEAPKNPDINKISNLETTWIDDAAYTAPVEWTVSGDELMIISFSDNTSGIRIKNPVVADAFRQLWHVMDGGLKTDSAYKKRPLKAKRLV